MANPLRNKLNQHANKSGRAYIEARVTDLNAIYSNARESLERSLISFVTSGKKSFTGRHLVALTEEIQQVFPKLEEAYREKAGQSIHYLVQSYYRSALNDLSMDDVPLGGFNKAQMQLAMDDMYTHIAGATRNMDEMAVKALRRISAQVIRESALTGETQAQVSKRLFLANGGTNFIFTDAKGATWNGEAYFDMLSRTTLNNSSRESYLQACADQGSDIVSVSFSGKPCPACAKWEGRLLSISGKTKGLPSLADAIAGGLFHPNCTHHLVAVPPEIAEEYYTPEGRPKTGLNSPGNEDRDDKDAWREYRKQQRGKTKKATSEKSPVTGSKQKTQGDLFASPVTIPQGKPVSDAIDMKIKDKDLREGAEHALDVISKIHGDGELPQIPIKSRMMRDEGRFRYIPGSKPTDIALSPGIGNPSLTAAHEIGHFLDFSALNEKRGVFGSKQNPAMENWKKAVENSDAIKKLRMKIGNKALDQGHIKYLLDESEIFARSYSQYIAQKSGDKIMMEELTGILDSNSGKMYNYQWKQDDFKPIASALDELFKLKGWMK